MVGWFYTNRDGVVCRCGLHEVGPRQLYEKLVGASSFGALGNAAGYVALCHFESGVARPLKQDELQHMVGKA
jgi:hypothetical protein